MVKKNTAKYIALLLAATCALSTGCEQNNQSTAEETTVTISDLQGEYEAQEIRFDSFLPVYQVKDNQCFTIRAKALPDDLSNVVTVYRDEIKDGNEVAVRALKTIKNRDLYLTIIPDETGFQAHEDGHRPGKSWGDASSFYIVIRYDLNSDTPQKTEVPSVIHFTPESKIPVVDLKYKVDDRGNFSLFWDEKNPAAQYRVYKEKDDGTISLIAATQLNYFDFSYGGDKKAFLFTSQYIETQNYNVNGEYFVTTVLDGEESKLSNGVRLSDCGDYIPQTLSDDLFAKHFSTLQELPQTAKVRTLNGGIIEKSVLYDFANVNQSNLSSGFEIDYSVQGTELTGYVYVESATVQDLTGGITINNYNQVIYQPSEIAGYIPAVNTTADKQTVEPEGTDAVIELNRYKIRKADNESMHTPLPEIPEGYIISAENALEDYLIRYLLSGATKIDLSPFPEAGNHLYLDRTMEKVLLNNPLILGVSQYSLDYTSLELAVVYYENENNAAAKREELIEWVERYVSQETTALNNEEKEKIIYDFLVEKYACDSDALKNVKETGYTSVDKKFSDSMNAYGALIYSQGLPAGYAAAFKLLCDYEGVECKTVSGSYKGIPHAWNAVKVVDTWAYVDVSNNYISSGIPYPVFNVGELPKDYKISTMAELPETTDKDGYYEEQGLSFSTQDELEGIIDKKLEDKTSYFILKNNTEDIDDQKACEMIADYVYTHAPESEFSNYYIGVENGFIIIKSGL